MENTLFNWLLEIPQTIANLCNWLISPISEKYINISPLGLLGIGGTTILLVIIGVHVVKLFIG